MEDEPLPDRRRHGYQDLEEKLDEHAQKITDRLEEFIRRALIGFAVIGITSAASLAGFGILLVKQDNTSKEIQAQRRESILRGCLEQNTRHDNTISQLQVVSAAAAKEHPKDAAQIAQSVKSSTTLIEALVPKENCLLKVKQATGAIGG